MPPSILPVIVHSPVRWCPPWQRPHEVFSRLARLHPVLFIEDPVTAAAVAAGLDEPQPNLFRLVPEMPQTSPDAQCEALLPLVYQALQAPALRGRFRAPMQWFCSPASAPLLLGEFGAAGAVYDCMGELPQQQGARAVLSERFLLANADVVFTATPELQRAKLRHNANTHYFGAIDDQAVDSMRVLMLEVIMAHRTIVGIFESTDAAEHAKTELVGAGIAAERIVLSASLTDDGIAAEAPGQSFENQPGQPEHDAAAARFGESVRTGACIVSVAAEGRDRANIERLLKMNGARHTADRPLM